MRIYPSGLHTFVSCAVMAFVIALLTACGGKTEKVVNESQNLRCAILSLAGTDANGWQEWFERHMKSTRRFSGSEVQAAVDYCLNSDLILILPNAKQISDGGKGIVNQFLQNGGRVLMCGLESDDAPHAEMPVYTFTSGTLRVKSSGDRIVIKPSLMKSLFWQGNNLKKDNGRIIPVAVALDEEGKALGRPAVVQLIPVENGQHAVYGWLSLDAKVEKTENLIPLVEQMIDVLSRKIYLHRFGVSQHSARSQTPLTANSEWILRRTRDLSPLRFCVEWIDSRGVEVKRILSNPLDPMVMPISLNIGLAPEVRGNSELYTLRFSIRDRNDQFTYDSFTQKFKVLSYTKEVNAADFIDANAGQLVHRRRPVFILGVNYWPRNATGLPSHGEHWLSAELFDPEIISSDLDLMVSAGINAITLEYTSVDQAPQIRFVLDELRDRGMWACLYVPALHPLDLRLDDAKRMLEALGLEEWPQVFALEVARGLAVKRRAEMRLLDPDWADWIQEHFNSPMEAEQKLGISLWNERGRLAGPTDAVIRKGPHRDKAAALYYAFLGDYVSRRMRYIREWLNDLGYQTLITARSRYGWPSDDPGNALDYLDISTAALHQDFLFPDAWSTHPLRTMHPDSLLLAAYAHGVSGGKPVLWSEFGQSVGSNPDPSSLQRQKEVYKHYLNAFVESGSFGGFAWWYPPGSFSNDANDWGIVDAQGSWRPVEETFRSARYSLRQSRIKVRKPNRKPTRVIHSAEHWKNEQKNRTGLFAEENPEDVNEWVLPGTGLSSATLLHPDGLHRWTEFDAFVLLNAEWGRVLVNNVKLERKPNESIRAYLGNNIEMILMNTGSVRWEKAGNRKTGSVWIRVSQPGNADVWLSSASLNRGEKHSLVWVPQDTGRWEIQAYLIGYGKFGERLTVEVTTPPQLF